MHTAVLDAEAALDYDTIHPTVAPQNYSNSAVSTSLRLAAAHDMIVWGEGIWREVLDEEEFAKDLLLCSCNFTKMDDLSNVKPKAVSISTVLNGNCSPINRQQHEQSFDVKLALQLQ